MAAISNGIHIKGNTIRSYMRKILIIFLAIIFGVHIPGLAFGWYYAIPWLDIPMHIAGGAWVGLLFCYIFSTRTRFADPGRKLPFLILGLGFVSLIGILWEFYEFLMDIVIFKAYLPLEAPGYILFDTHTDFLNDLIGGAIAIGLFIFRARKNKEQV